MSKNVASTNFAPEFKANCGPDSNKKFKIFNLSSLKFKDGSFRKIDESQPLEGVEFVLGSGSLKLTTSQFSVPLNKEKLSVEEEAEFTKKAATKVNKALKAAEISGNFTEKDLTDLVTAYEKIRAAFLGKDPAKDFLPNSAKIAVQELHSLHKKLFGENTKLTLEAGSILGDIPEKEGNKLDAKKGRFVMEQQFKDACSGLNNLDCVIETDLPHVRLLKAFEIAKSGELDSASVEMLDHLVKSAESKDKITAVVMGGGAEYTLKQIYSKNERLNETEAQKVLRNIGDGDIKASDDAIDKLLKLDDESRAADKNEVAAEAMFSPEVLEKEFGVRGGLVVYGPAGSNRSFSVINKVDGKYEIKSYEFNKSLFSKVKKGVKNISEKHPDKKQKTSEQPTDFKTVVAASYTRGSKKTSSTIEGNIFSTTANEASAPAPAPQSPTASGMVKKYNSINSMV